MTRVFISYRRDGAGDVVARLYDRLTFSFGERNIFRDIESIPVGSDFESRLQQALAKCNVGLVLIGPKWASATNPVGQLRLFDPNDFVRLEVEYLLRRQVPIIPVLVHGAMMPAAANLPPSLAPLVTLQAVVLRPDWHFDGDVSQLIRAMRRRVAWRPVYPAIAAGAGLPLLAVPLFFLTSALMTTIPTSEASHWFAALLTIVFAGLVIVALLSVPAAYIASLVRSWRLRQWTWVWILAGAPFAGLAATIVAIAALGATVGFVNASTDDAAGTFGLGGAVWLCVVVVFGLFGPVDRRTRRDAATTPGRNTPWQL
jgi:hypothetical protein